MLPDSDSMRLTLESKYQGSFSPCCTWKCVATAISGSVDISKVPGCHLLQQMRLPCFNAELISILVLIWMVIVIIREMFHGRISLNSVFLLLLLSYVSGLRLESLIVSIRSSLTHLHGLQLVVLLP